MMNSNKSKSQEGSLVLSGDLKTFFREEVVDARSTLGLNLCEQTEFYIVNLLADFSVRDDARPAPGEEPLALMRQRAMEMNELERLSAMKQLGDMALYVAGFFTEFISRSLVDLNYYVSMGSSAYGNVAQLIAGRKNDSPMADLYNNLDRRFAQLVELLKEVSYGFRTPRDQADLLRLYESWGRTGDSRSKRLLIENGLLPQTVMASGSSRGKAGGFNN